MTQRPRPETREFYKLKWDNPARKTGRPRLAEGYVGVSCLAGLWGQVLRQIEAEPLQLARHRRVVNRFDDDAGKKRGHVPSRKSKLRLRLPMRARAARVRVIETFRPAIVQMETIALSDLWSEAVTDGTQHALPYVFKLRLTANAKRAIERLSRQGDSGVRRRP